MPRLSLIVPVLDEAPVVAGALARLAPLRSRGCEVVVADGGSTDGTPGLAAAWADRVVTAPRGRGSQMNAGAAVARAPVLLFLHCDTVLPESADHLVLAALAGGGVWGRFDVSIHGRSRWLPVVATMMNARSRMTGIATGDQAIFVRREVFASISGFADWPLMEDIDLSRRLKRLSPPVCLRERVVTSGRRWDTSGAVRTILTMWFLRLSFFLGASPWTLARLYGYRPRDPR